MKDKDKNLPKSNPNTIWDNVGAGRTTTKPPTFLKPKDSKPKKQTLWQNRKIQVNRKMSKLIQEELPLNHLIRLNQKIANLKSSYYGIAISL